jgi:hypothetical protein
MKSQMGGNLQLFTNFQVPFSLIEHAEFSYFYIKSTKIFSEGMKRGG